MSLVYSQTASPYNGIIQQLEFKLFGDNGLARISGNSVLLGQMTTRVNMALDSAFAIAFDADGKWQFDDNNHADYPILTTNIVANQRDYSFTTDSNSNLILKIYKVAILKSATETVYEEIMPIDAHQDFDSPLVADDTSVTGTPTAFDVMANGIFLDPIPSYSVNNGLKVYVAREGNYFTTSDTTQKAAIPGLFHEYLVYHAAFGYAVDNGLAQAGGFQAMMLDQERKMRDFFGKRDKYERHVMKPKKILYI